MNFWYKKVNFSLLAFVLIVLGIVTYLIETEVVPIKTYSYDFIVRRVLKDTPVSKDIILVTVDDDTLKAEEEALRKWHKSRFLEIFEYLNNKTEAKLIGFTHIITPDDIESYSEEVRFFNKIKDYNKLYQGIIFSDRNTSSIKEKAKLYEDILLSKNNIKLNFKKPVSQKQEGFLGVIRLPVAYLNNASHLGTLNINKDFDDVSRKAYDFIKYKDTYYPSMELALLADYKGVNSFIYDGTYLKADNNVLKIPTVIEDKGISHYTYYHKIINKYQKISASKVLNSLRAIKLGQEPELSPEIFKDKIVLVGMDSTSIHFDDNIKTPLGKDLTKIELHASILDNLLQNEFYKHANTNSSIFYSIILFIVVFMFVVFLKPYPAFLASVSIIFVLFIITSVNYSKFCATDFALPLVYMIFACITGVLHKFLLENEKRGIIQQAMGKYIPKDVIKNVANNMENITLGGKKAEVTVLFADIRGFTTISEKLKADEVTKILNEYFSAMLPIVEKNNGVLNKFAGDAVLAIFGEPINNPHHALDAVKCANKMLKKVKSLQTKWLEEGKPKIEIGIGISTGEVFVGNIGSEDRLEYTVIGDTVNTASRIEDYNKIYRTNFLISQTTFDFVQNYVDVVKIREVAIRGKTKKLNIYEVLKVVDDN